MVEESSQATRHANTIIKSICLIMKTTIVDTRGGMSTFFLQWGAFYLLIANFFVTQNIGGAKELVVLL